MLKAATYGFLGSTRLFLVKMMATMARMTAAPATLNPAISITSRSSLIARLTGAAVTVSMTSGFGTVEAGGGETDGDEAGGV